jgi:hypothetical protein
MKLFKFATIAALGLASLGVAPPESKDAGPFVGALWLIQRHGTIDAADPRNDISTKGSLAKALGKDGILKPGGVQGLIDPDTFAKLAGPDGRLDPAEVRQAVEADIPASRLRLLPRIAAHADFLTTSFDQIDETHRQAGETLSDWIATNHQPGKPLDVTVICTGNSRRSILGSTMGNIAAAYYGMPEIRFHSGGTAPSAFNPRTIAALKEIGVEIDPTGEDAPRGDPATANPVYRVRWGQPGDPSFEATEFSKTYFDPTNPRQGFAALMVCGEADEGCPLVKGAALRVSMPYLDPKIYDGSPYESARYAERRDDMARLMLASLLRAKQRISSGKPQ